MSLKKIKKFFQVIPVFFILLTVSGCAVNWYNLYPDSQEAPAERIKEELTTYQARLKFRRKAYFVGQKTTQLYITHDWFRNYVTAASFETVFTQRLGSELQSRFGKLRDIELVGLHRNIVEEQSFGTDTGPVMDRRLPKQAEFLILYKVTNVEVRESAITQMGRAVTDVVSAGLDMGGRHHGAYYTREGGDMVRLYYATVTAQIQMIETKTGKSVFSYYITANSIPSPICALNNINDCVRKLAEKACANYLYQFGPPIYVTESRAYGKMVQLNIGSDYGVVPGMKFRFIQKNEFGQEFQIGTGYVQDNPDDIGPNYCRVIVNGQGSPEKFRVMKNVLAKPILMQ